MIIKNKVAVLISGSGSNLQALIDASEQTNFPAKICLVISNKPEAYGLIRAKNHNIKTATISHKDYNSREEFDSEIHKMLLENNIDIVCLAGFMRVLSKEFVEKWIGRMINIHPSLLPKHKGAQAVKDAFEAGDKKTGCTVHYVVPEIDSGEIIIQSSVNIETDDNLDSLLKKIHTEEHIAYPKALQKLCEKLI
jgi:formyltetrahydrofolate-dependent phosphoribosylglycinamide formyltransferase